MKALQNFYYGETHYFIGDEFPHSDAVEHLEKAGFIGEENKDKKIVTDSAADRAARKAADKAAAEAKAAAEKEEADKAAADKAAAEAKAAEDAKSDQ
jgi:hypothetical protein